MKYEVRQIDALAEPEGGWTWNASFHLFYFETDAENVRRAFMGALKRRGIAFRRGTVRVDCSDGSIYEVVSRKDGCPEIAAIQTED